MNIRIPRKTEMFSAISHFIATIFAIIGSIILIFYSADDWSILIVTIIFSICMCFMFSASTLYHTFKQKENEQLIWRRIDHISIYFMIAGTYTAISYLYADGNFRWWIISLQWSFALLGTILKIFTINIPSWIDVGIYLIMGWMIVIRLDYIFNVFPIKIFSLVLSGGIAYTIGAILHAINKKKPFPNIFEFHDIFHILIIVGASLHYTVIISYVI